jgi:hypothetical protein
MKWPIALVLLALAGSPIVSARQSSTDDLKGRPVTLRACVGKGIAGSVLLNRVQIPVKEGVAAPAPARYLFDKPGAIQDYLGGEIEILAQVREVQSGDIELSMNDGLLAEIQPATEAVGTSGTDQPSPVLKMDITKIRMLSTVCR